DAAGGDAACLGQDAHDRLADDRLAGAALSDDGDGAALRHPEGNTVNRLDHALVDMKLDLEVGDLEDIAHRRSSQGGSAATTPSALKLASVGGSKEMRSLVCWAVRSTTSRKPSRVESIRIVLRPPPMA